MTVLVAKSAMLVFFLLNDTFIYLCDCKYLYNHSFPISLYYKTYYYTDMTTSEQLQF